MAKKNSLDLSGLDLSDLDLSVLNDKKEKPSLDLSGLDLSDLDLSVLDNEEEVKKKSQEEPTASTSSDGESLSKEVEPTAERSELSEEDRLKVKETSGLFNTFTQMEDLNGPPISEERMSNIDIPLKQKQKDLEKADEYYTTPEYKTGLGEDINKIESEDLKYVDYLSITDPEEYVENNLNLEDYIFADSKVVEDLIKNKQKDALKKIGLDQGDKTRKNYATEIQDSDNSFTTEDITEMVDSTELSDVKRFGVNRLRLDEDQEKEYKEDILELSALKENKNKTPEEKLLQFSLSKKVAKLRENQDKQFINPETGQIDGAVKKEVTEKAKLYSKDLKTDYRKFLDKYKEEYHNIKGIEEEMKILTKSETPPSRYIIENYAYANLREAVSEDRPGFQPKIGDKSVAVEKLKNKLLFLYDGLAKSEKNFMALNRALLLNEDPAAVSRGFKMLEGIPLLQGAGEILTSAGESLAETVTGEDIVTDKDYANTIVQLANETGVKLTEEQYDRGKEDFEEKLGGAVGTSVPMMAEIAFNVLVTKNIGAALKIPSYLSKLKKLKDSPKIASFVGKAMEATTQAIAFEFAEGGSLAMGAGEYYGGRLGEKIVSAITKGKGGKFLALFGKVVGAGTAGTVEEYAGEFIDEGFKQGFFTKEQFETTFGRTYDEALDKFLITAVMATAMGGAAEVGNVLSDAKSYYKNLGDTKRLTELEKLIEANKEPSESTGEGKNLELKVNKEEAIGEEELVPFTEEVDKDGKTFLTTEGETTEGETKTEESIEEEITEPTQEPKTELEVKKESISSELNELQELKKELETKESSEKVLSEGLEEIEGKRLSEEVKEKQIAEERATKVKDLEAKVAKNRLDKVESEQEIGKSLEESEATAKIESEKELAEGLEEIEGKRLSEEVKEKQIVEERETQVKELEAKVEKNRLEKVESEQEIGKSLEESEATAKIEAEKELAEGLEKIEEGNISKERKESLDQEILQEKRDSKVRELESKVSKNRLDKVESEQAIGKSLEKSEAIAKVQAEKELSEGLEKIEQERIAEEVQEKQKLEERETQVKELEAKVEKNRLEKVESEIEEGKSLEESESTAKVEAEEALSEGLKEIKKKADKEEVETNQEKEKEKVKKIIKENISTEDKKKIASEEGIDAKDVEAKVIEKVADRSYLAKGKSALAKVVKAIRDNIRKLIFLGGLTYIAFSGVSITQGGVPTYRLENVIDAVFSTEYAEYAKYYLDKKGYSLIDENILEVEKAPVIVETPTPDPIFKIIKTSLDEGYSKDSLISYRSQWSNSEGFRYIPTPVQGQADLDFEYDKVHGVGHFVIDASASQSKPYQHKNSKITLRQQTQDSAGVAQNLWVPVYTNNADGSVQLKYKKTKELTSEDRNNIYGPLRQVSFSDVDFDRGEQAVKAKSGYGGAGISVLLFKNGKQTSFPYKPHLGKKARDAYGRFSGASVVFIFNDKYGNTIIRDVAGSLNQIREDGESITKQYDLKEGELVMGYHDMGSFSAKPKAAGGTIKQKQWSGFNDESMVGSALLIPMEGNPETPSLPSKPNELGGDPISGLVAGVSLLLRALRRRKRKGKKLDKQDAKDIDAEIARLTKQLSEVDTEIISQKEKQELDKVKQELEDIKSELESKPASDRTFQDKIILDSIKKKGLTSAQAKSLIKNYKTSKKSIKKDIRDQTGQTDTSDKITITQKKLAKELYKAEEKALKNLKVSQKKLISNLFKKLSELAGIRKGKEKSTLKGKVSFSNVKKILQELNKLDPSNDNDVLALEHKIDQLVKDSEFEVKKQEAIKLQEKLQKIGKKRKGVRGKYAAELNDIDLNKVESIDAFLETAKSLLGSFKGAIKKDNEITITETDPGIVTQLEETIKTLKEEQAKYEELLGERREIKRLEDSEKSDIETSEEYAESGLSDVMTLEEYQQFRESSPEEAVKAIPEKGKKELALRKAVSERIDNLKGWLKDNEKTLTQGQKRKINDIINNKELINDDSTNMTDVVDTFNALEEILSFDSTAGITRITAKLEGIQLGKKIKKYFLGKFKDWGSIGIDFKTMNQSTYLKAISNSLDTAKELSAVLLVNIKKAKVKAKKISDSFNIKVDKLADKLKIKQEQSVKIGVFSRLKQHTEGLTQEEIDEDFALKLESIKNEIIELKKQNKKTSEVKSNKRKSKVLEEVYSKIKDAKSYSEIESNLSENESKMLAFLEESFAEIRPDLENTYLENQGKDMEGVSNYIPTVVSNKRDGSTQTGDLKDNVSRESLDRETSGRTIKRSKTDPTGKTQYNYDIVEVAKFGMKQSLFDINVLYDSQVLANTLSSKDFKEAIDNSKILKDLKEKLANTYSPNYFAIDRTEQDNITREIIDYFKAFVVMPLKTVWQYAKQPISIMGATLTRVNLKATGRSYNIISKSIVSKEYRQRLDKFLENSTVSIRTVEGDADIASSDPLYIKLLNKLPKKLAGKPTAFTKKYISDALSLSDDVAAKGSFLSFYINERLKKDPNYVFDLDKEIANPDMKAVGKADVEADWVNNNSDVDESGTFLKGNTTIKNLLFLFKSFAVNQSINTILDARNILSSQRTGKVEASRALAGTLVGALAFEGMRQVIKKSSEEILSSFLDDMEDEEKKEVSEEIGSILVKSLYNALLDVVAGGAPSDLTYYVKVGVNYANWMLFYEDENENRKKRGKELIKKRDKDPFFISDSPSGIVGLAESYITAGYKSLDVLFSKYSNEEMDRVATLNLIMMFLQDENLRRPTSKAVNKYKKEIKKREKKFNRR